MATNMRVTTTQVLGTKLRIECSEHAPLSDIEILKLRGSLGLAAKVLEVAMEAGFGSLGRFNAAFRQLCGCSPRQYRSRHRL